jgi:glycosyltransferase involved in cell wall biosynthesis
MTNICIDGNEANIPNRVGSNVYAYQVLKQIEKITRGIENHNFTVVLRKAALNDMPQERVGWKYVCFGPKPFWTQWALPLYLYLNKNQYDVFFSPGHYAPFLCPVPSVTTIMDTAYLDFPHHFKQKDLFQLSYWTKRAVKNAQKVISISHATKLSVIKNYNKNPDSVVVAFPGLVEKKSEIIDPNCNLVLKNIKINSPYILFVGTIQPRKNVTTLIEAFEIFTRMTAGRNLKKSLISKKNTKQKFQLILAGKVGWLAGDTLERINNSPLVERIVQTGFISDSQKNCLYKQALATVLLGEGEGFGLPPLESLSHGTPVVVANNASLPEVVGEVGLKVDPKDPQAVAQALYDIYSFSARERARYRKKALEQSQNFSWKKTSEIILKVLSDVGNQKT